MPSLYRAVLKVLNPARDVDRKKQHQPGRLSTTNSFGSTKPTSKTATFSFNNYAFKPVQQPHSSNVNKPVDPADLTRRLERYLATLGEEKKPQTPAAAGKSAQSPASPASPNRVATNPQRRSEAEAQRQDARRAMRRSHALAQKGQSGGSRSSSAGVEARELARRLEGGGGGDAKHTTTTAEKRGASRRPQQQLVRSKSSSAALQLKDVRMAATTTRTTGGKGQVKRSSSSSNVRRTIHAIEGGEMWRVYINTQAGFNSQAVAKPQLHKSASARSVPRPRSTADLEHYQVVSGKILQKRKISGHVAALGDSKRSSCGDMVAKDNNITAVGRRPDWSQNDEVDDKPGGLHLHIPSFAKASRHSSGTTATDSESGDERTALSICDDKKNNNNRRSTYINAAANDKRPSTLLVSSPTSTSTSAAITLQASYPHTPTSPPSITLSPVDPLLLPHGFFAFGSNDDGATVSSPTASKPAPHSASISPAHGGSRSRSPQKQQQQQPSPNYKPATKPSSPTSPATRYRTTKPRIAASAAAAVAAAAAEPAPPLPTTRRWPGPAAPAAPAAPATRQRPGASRSVSATSLSLFPTGAQQQHVAKKGRSVTFAEKDQVLQEEVKRPVTAGGLIGGRKTKKTVTIGVNQAVAGRGQEEKGAVVGVKEVKTPTRLVFWRRDSAAAKGGEEGPPAAASEEGGRSPSRLAFWKRGHGQSMTTRA